MDKNLFLKKLKTSSQANLNLLLFHHAGGAASSYQPWIQYLQHDFNLYALQLPGREERLGEPFFTDLAPIIDALLPEIIALDAPFLLFGHSLGGLAAYELSVRLQLHAPEFMPLHLYVSAHRAPHRKNTSLKPDEFSDAQFINAIAKSYGGIPQEVLDSPDLIEFLMPRLRADFQICANYTYQQNPPLEIPLTCLGGTADNSVALENLGEWEAYTKAAFRCHEFAGDHFFLNQHLPAITQHIRDDAQGYAQSISSSLSESI